MQTNIFAYTAPESIYPAFVSLNLRNGYPILTVRSPRKENGDCGETVDVPLSHAELVRLQTELQTYITTPVPQSA